MVGIERDYREHCRYKKRTDGTKERGPHISEVRWEREVGEICYRGWSGEVRDEEIPRHATRATYKWGVNVRWEEAEEKRKKRGENAYGKGRGKSGVLRVGGDSCGERDVV